MMLIKKIFIQYIALFFCLLFTTTCWAAPRIQTWTSPAGVPVYFIQRNDLPMLDVSLVFDAGSSRDGKLWGLSTLTGMMIDQGTTTLTANQIADQWSASGALFGVNVTRDMTQLHLRTLTQPSSLASSMKLLHQLLLNPAFSSSDFSIQKNQLQAAIRYQKQKPNALALMAFFQSLYGPYSYAHSPKGSLQTVSAITTDSVRDFYQQYYVARNAKLILVGNLTAKKAREWSSMLLADLPAGQKAKALPPVAPIKHPDSEVIPFPSKQSSIVLGQLGITRESPDYFAYMVGNHILGGLPLSSILFNQIRNQRGLAYSVASYFIPLQQTGPFIITLQTQAKQSVKATALAQQILQRFISKPVSAAQLALAKSNMKGAFAIALSSNQQLSDLLTYIAFYDRPLNYLDTYQKNINAVTAKDIQQAFSSLFTPDQLLIVTLKPEKQHAS